MVRHFAECLKVYILRRFLAARELQILVSDQSRPLEDTYDVVCQQDPKLCKGGGGGDTLCLSFKHLITQAHNNYNHTLFR